jgi:predicted amidohydrolase
MIQPRSLAVAQTCPVKGDVQANLAEHLRLTQIAASEGAQIVVFPALSLTGYALRLASALAFSEDDPRLSPLLEASSAAALTRIVGAPVRLGRRLHIGAFIVSPDHTLALYTKHYLGAFSASARCDGTVPPAEGTVFQPGDRNPLVRFRGHVAAVAVCADIGHASHPQQAGARGASTYLASMFVIPSEFAGETTKLRAYAVQHSMMVALANYGSPTGGLASAGRSAIWSETGARLAQLDVRGAGVAVVTATPQGWRAKTCRLSNLKTAPAPEQG